MFIVIGIGYVNSNIKVSSTCGPFTDSKLQTPLEYLFQLKNDIATVKALDVIMKLILQPGLLFFMFFILWLGLCLA